MILLASCIALAGPVSVGTSVTGGARVHLQAGVAEVLPGVDLLDLEIHVSPRVITITRVGRFAVGRGAMGLTDLEVDVLLRVGEPGGLGWAPLWAVGLGPRLTVGADEVVLGARALGRLGAAYDAEGRRTLQLFAEPYLTGERGRDVAAAGVGLRAGVALTWEVGR